MSFFAKHRKHIGVILAAFFVCRVISVAVQLILNGSDAVNSLISIFPSAILVSAFFIGDQPTRRVFFAVSLFAAAVVSGVIMTLDKQLYLYSFFCILLFYAAGGSLIAGKKYYKASVVAVTTVLLFMAFYGCVSSIATLLCNNEVREAVNARSAAEIESIYNTFRFFFQGFSTLSALETAALLLCLVCSANEGNGTEKRGVYINTGVIDFAELLLFIEDQYKSGKITSAEYIEKRKEIVSKL